MQIFILKIIPYKYRQEILAMFSNLACEMVVDVEYIKQSYIWMAE